jgi:hypothetical protein
MTPAQEALIEACQGANCRIDRLPGAPGEQAATAVRVPFPDASTEMLAAARWARSLLEGGAPGSIAVVVPDLAERRKEVERIFRSVLQPASVLPGREPSIIVNLSAGEPLTTVPLAASALALLSVRPEGNPAARKMVGEVFQTVDRKWRGIGTIPQSGWALRPEYDPWNAEKKYGVEGYTAEEPVECVSGAVLRGVAKPCECPAFGNKCTPEHPLGAPMVSSEGACSAYYRYRR